MVREVSKLFIALEFHGTWSYQAFHCIEIPRYVKFPGFICIEIPRHVKFPGFILH